MQRISLHCLSGKITYLLSAFRKFADFSADDKKRTSQYASGEGRGDGR